MTEMENLNETSKSIINFLKSNVPKSDVSNIETELKKDFFLAKKKSNKMKRKPKKKINTLTRKEKKALNFYSIPRDSLNYSEMLQLNTLWTEYITQLLELNHSTNDIKSKSMEQMSISLYKADFHGSMLQVIRSKCPSYVGKVGVCIMDTKNTFKLLSKDNIITTIPKKECVFKMQIKDNSIMFYGKHLCNRPAERSVKKVKNQLHPDL